MGTEVEVRVRIPGIFYRSPDPDSPPFVDVGDHVDTETVVGLVEVMKQFHEVLAECAGSLISFEVENEAAVAPGDVIARVSEG